MKEPRNKEQFDKYIKKIGYFTKNDIVEISIGTFVIGFFFSLIICAIIFIIIK